MRVVETSTGIAIHAEDGDSAELLAIGQRYMPDWLRLFAKKNADYGGGSAFELGERGQYSDIHRKMIKLKRAMWDGEELDFEGTDEIISDLIGHLFLTLHMRAMKEEANRVYAYSDDDSAVDAIFRMVGGSASKAYQMSYGLNPPFGEMVRARASKQMEDEAREEMAARCSDPSLSLETATQRLRDAGMTNAKGEPVLMSRLDLNGFRSPLPAMVHHTLSKLTSSDFGEADQAQHIPLKPGDILHTYMPNPKPVIEEGDEVRVTGLGEPTDGTYTIVKPLRDDDPVHPQDDEDDGLVSLAKKVEDLDLTEDQKVEFKADLDKLFRNSDKQRALLSRFERKIRGY